MTLHLTPTLQVEGSRVPDDDSVRTKHNTRSHRPPRQTDGPSVSTGDLSFSNILFVPLFTILAFRMNSCGK